MARPKPEAPFKRLNVKLTAKAKARLDELVEMSSANSITNVIKRAVRVYKIALDHHEKGGELILVTKDGKEKQVMFEW